MSAQEEKILISKLFKGFNQNNLLYEDGKFYDKLISPDYFSITQQEYDLILKRGQQLLEWHETTAKVIKIALTSNTHPRIKQVFTSSLSSKAIEYQTEISRMPYKPLTIARMDTTNTALRLHEAQFRWGAPGHYYFINKIFDELSPKNKDFAPFESDLVSTVQTYVDAHVLDKDNECILFIAANKYILETSQFCSKLSNVITCTNSDLNSAHFSIDKKGLVHKASKKHVKAIVRREMSLYSLSDHDFGCQLIELFINQKLDFEPGLSMINDNKVGIPLVFDNETKHYYDSSLDGLYLPTAFYEPSFTSFNHVFNTNYTSLNDFLSKTSARSRKYVFKYSGNILSKSFGGGEVYRWTTTKNKITKLANKNSLNPNEWIMQKLDDNKSAARYGIGDYSNPSKIELTETSSASTRLTFVIHRTSDNKIKRVLGMAALVTDEWKSRYKTSNQVTGEGSIIMPIKVAI